jgi:putative hydrolase of the HAD superfamily
VKVLKAIIFDLGDTLIQEEQKLGRTYVKVPYIRETLNQLTAEYKLGIITNVHPSTTESRIHEILQLAGIHDFFDVIIISSVVGFEKPDERIFHLAFEQLGVLASETVMIGNRVSADIRGGNRVGMITILLKWNDRYPEPSLIEEEKPDYIISSYKQLKSILRKLRNE